jgi:hypothetical protein
MGGLMTLWIIRKDIIIIFKSCYQKNINSDLSIFVRKLIENQQLIRTATILMPYIMPFIMLAYVYLKISENIAERILTK